MQTVWMLIICWGLENGEPIEVWRIQQPATVEHCAEMSMFSGIGRIAAIIVKCNPWYVMAPTEDWHRAVAAN